jgi:hypothetical protein
VFLSPFFTCCGHRHLSASLLATHRRRFGNSRFVAFPLPAAPLQITRRVACRMTPLQLQLYADVLAKDWAKVNAMGGC